MTGVLWFERRLHVPSPALSQSVDVALQHHRASLQRIQVAISFVLCMELVRVVEVLSAFIQARRRKRFGVACSSP